MMLRDDFNGDVINRRNWKELYGGEPSDICGIVVSGNSLLFNKVFFFYILSSKFSLDYIFNLAFKPTLLGFFCAPKSSLFYLC